MNDAPLPSLFGDSPPQIVQVLLPLPLAGAYSYKVSPEMRLAPGDFVSVPLGPRQMRGVVWFSPDKLPDVAPEKLKPVTAKFEMLPLAEDLMRFVDWVAAYTLSAPGAVLRMVMRSGAALDLPKPQTGFLLTDPPPDVKLTAQRQKVLAAAAGLNMPASARSLAQMAGVSDGVVRALANAGALQIVASDPDVPFETPNPERKGKSLSPDQHSAAAELTALVRQRGYSCALLEGVTGSGKTEVYLEAAAEALKQDRTAQVLVLLPEIALTLPFLRRLETRFGAAPAHWHSDVGQATRRRVWRRIADGSAQLVVGARSALFLPFQNLKLIIVDEEHDAAYKQGEGVLYQARDMAVARGALSGALSGSEGTKKPKGFPVILASATPSLETTVNAAQGRYAHVVLPSRFGGASMPDIELVDLRKNPPAKGTWLSPVLIKAVNETLAKGDQTLLFLNRRGYAPLTICRRCGERMKAPDSDTWLVEHRFTGRLVCHHTGFSMPKPDTCPHCGGKDSLSACGPGVERIAEEATNIWPDQKIAIFSSDTTSTAEKGQELLARMRNKEIDILVATQMAAKGHHFPDLTLVGVVDADLGLAGGDLRAGERTWQILSQVAGRAGRAAKPGKALLQTYNPDHAVIAGMASGEREAFMNAERDGRAEMGFPPFGRLAALLLTGNNEDMLNNTARALVSVVPQADGVEVWGPAPAPLYRLRGDFRIRFLIKSRRDINIQSFITSWLAQVKIPSSVRKTIDVDPYNFM